MNKIQRLKNSAFSSKKDWRYYGFYLLVYTLLFTVVSLGVFAWFIMKKKSFVWTTDAVSQYIPKAVYFIRYMKDYLQRILSGDFTFRMYDFSIGYGDSVPLHTEPVYWLYLLFDEKNIETAYNILMLFRFYLSGLTFSIFCLYFHFDRWETMIGSMVYIFTGYSLLAGMRHAHFMVSMIMLPLLLLGMEEILRKRKWYLCTLFVAVSFWCGYYFTYMSTFAMGFYFLIRYFFSTEKKSVKGFFSRVAVIAGSYLLGIGISNITLFNTFAGYLTSSRTGITETRTSSLLRYPSGWSGKVFMSFLSSDYHAGKWLWLGFAAVAYLCILLLFIRKGNRQLKMAFILGTIFCLFPVFAYVFGGFGPITNRWSYMYSFVVALITAKMVKELLNVTKKELFLLFVGMLPYLYVGVGRYLLRGNYVRSVRDAGIFLFLTWMVVAICHFGRRIPFFWKRVAFTANIVVLIWFVGACRFAPRYGNMISQFTTSGNVYKNATSTPLKVFEDTADDSEFYRVYSKTTKSNVQGTSMILGFHGILYFNSTIGKPVIDFYRELGLTSWSLVRLRGLDGRGFLNALASVKYESMNVENSYDIPYGYQESEEITKGGNTYHTYESDFALPVGYTYDKVISFDEFEKLETEKRQEMMLQALVLNEEETDITAEEVSAQDALEGNIEFTGTFVPITDVEMDEGIEYDGTSIKVQKKNSSITFFYDGLADSETYLSFHGLHMDTNKKKYFDISSDSKNYKISYYLNGDKHTYNTKQQDYIFNLGYTEDAKTFCKVTFKSKCTLTFDEVAIYCQPMEQLSEVTAARMADEFENIKVDVNTVTGTITASKDEYLAFSIPYDSGWSAYVDGVKTKLMQANVMYMALPVSQGEHDIKLVYELPGIKISLCITLCSILILLLLLLRQKRYLRKN